MKVTIELSGGLDLCFDGHKTFEVVLENQENIKMGDLITVIAKNYVKKKPEFFVGADNQLRAGILVLINDADWELEGKDEANVENKDRISFISTLHGG
ncbi:transmembrane protein, putative (macronuclear) [Tetrahymena thermophila SB210]|uniref:Ubiquitin-related modifier 1 homolog n=1 Tax=Tetrahymena thermophila (strain SB210) TaxID=312017 RepID=I7MCR2_TETTS|nr:transmembrane protein, putative [Tetrahymena thermophila SB210]EAR84671.1 transmembrane protein, putative [Tetrahymena thermophila SB210]|eukprot:XP_001032334.1 transmembrane protein, putative [Tetrahymena thermophila SB210]